MVILQWTVYALMAEKRGQRDESWDALRVAWLAFSWDLMRAAFVLLRGAFALLGDASERLRAGYVAA
eukprot:scaffold103800_cov22-Tisochrysis_lutea.AAC.1